MFKSITKCKCRELEQFLIECPYSNFRWMQKPNAVIGGLCPQWRLHPLFQQPTELFVLKPLTCSLLWGSWFTAKQAQGNNQRVPRPRAAAGTDRTATEGKEPLNCWRSWGHTHACCLRGNKRIRCEGQLKRLKTPHRAGILDVQQLSNCKHLWIQIQFSVRFFFFGSVS